MYKPQIYWKNEYKTKCFRTWEKGNTLITFITAVINTENKIEETLCESLNVFL